MTDPIDELRRLAAAAPPPVPRWTRTWPRCASARTRSTDADVAALKDAGLSEDEIFEHTVTAAIGEGLRRLDRATEAIG